MNDENAGPTEPTRRAEQAEPTEPGAMVEPTEPTTPPELVRPREPVEPRAPVEAVGPTAEVEWTAPAAAEPVEPRAPVEAVGPTAEVEPTEPAAAPEPVEPPALLTEPAALPEPVEPTVSDPPALLPDPADFPDPAGPPELVGTDALFEIGGSDESLPDGAPRERERRWPLLAALCALALLGLSGVAWLLASLPHPPPRPTAAHPPASTTASRPPSPDPVITTVSPWPTVTLPAPIASRLPTIAITSITAVRPSPTPKPTPTSPPRRTTTPPPPPPSQVLVPNVVGLRQPEATSVLTAVGFRVSAVPVTYGGKRDLHRVVWESPPAGSILARGSTVTIFVSIGTF
jgi:PASTA domain